MDEGRNRYKACTPEETVDKIQDLLKRMGITVTEQWMDTVCASCFSLRVQIEGTGIGQNGKGLSKAFARASAYGEFMERLLTGFLLGGVQVGTKASFYLSKDEKILEEAEIRKLAEANPAWLQTLGEKIGAKSNWKLLALSSNQLEEKEAWVCLPFWKLTDGSGKLLKDDVLHWIPVTLVQAYYASNGASAGNTYEECFVQGFSEIIERHHSLRFFLEDLTPPSIPKEALKQFPEIWELMQRIQNQEKGRFVVKCYDCSMEEAFPVVATVLIDNQTHQYGIRFGAHPVFEIALERTLTEMFQGRSLQEAACVKELVTSTQERQDINCIHNLIKAGTGSIHGKFFADKADFSPNGRLWEQKQDIKSNESLYQFCLTYARYIKQEILVRKIEIEGFWTVQILMPGYSEVFQSQGLERLLERESHNRWKPYLRNGLIGAEQDCLLELTAFLWEKLYFAQENTLGYLVGLPLREEADTVQGFMNQLLLAYFLRKAEAAATETLGLMLRYLPKKGEIDFYDCLLQSLKLLQGESAIDCQAVLAQFYEGELVRNCIEGILYFRAYEGERIGELPWLWKKLGFFGGKDSQYALLVENLERYSLFVSKKDRQNGSE